MVYRNPTYNTDKKSKLLRLKWERLDCSQAKLDSFTETEGATEYRLKTTRADDFKGP